MGFVSPGHFWLILLLLIVVLIIWGPGKLPEVGSGMGKAIREFKKATSEARDSVVNASEHHSEAGRPVDGATAARSEATEERRTPV
jgi:sec-independent protein translocase protein TatA